jgi:hypothetical protein
MLAVFMSLHLLSYSPWANPHPPPHPPPPRPERGAEVCSEERKAIN